eukprot:gi/632986000/ref/XP_007909997.1/ PREDICTED: zinc-binding protein A33-like [Callorhinchus milii]
MAGREQDQSLAEDLTCPVCLDLFRHPVYLLCGHNFCRSCIAGFWERQEAHSCPECRQLCPGSELKPNRVLASLAEKARNLSLDPKRGERKHYCDDHREELKLFCETDEKLICLMCLIYPEEQNHKSHNVMSIDKAAEIYKEKLKSYFNLVLKRKDAVLRAEFGQKEKISVLKEQARSLQNDITAEFVEMHQCLNDTEQRVVRELREREEKILHQMEEAFTAFEEEIKSIDQELATLQRQMDEQDMGSFLREEVSRKISVSEEWIEPSVVQGNLTLAIPKGLTVWREMIHTISLAPARLTLDPDTAHRWLILSKDLTSVRFGEKMSSSSVTTGRGSVTIPLSWDLRASHQGDITGRCRWATRLSGLWDWPQSPLTGSNKSNGRQRVGSGLCGCGVGIMRL